MRRALSVEGLRGLRQAYRDSRRASYFLLRHRVATEPVVGDAPVVVSMASHDHRLRTAHLALEAIGHGTLRPRRLILWVPDAAVVARPPASLARLMGRGLELRCTEDWGPHNKYFPYVRSEDSHELPLVTADDDVLYGDTWLAELIAAHEAHPHDVVAHRAHRVRLAAGRILPYAQWTPADPQIVSCRTFPTGISGVLYPPRMLDALREAGTAFRACAPRADDVWLHAVALRHGVLVRPVGDGRTSYRSIPGTWFGGLWAHNVWGGGNDEQIAATYTPEDVAVMWQDQLGTEGP